MDSVSLKNERKWIHMIKNWDQIKNSKSKKIRERCRKGIPGSIRSRAWLLISGGADLMSKNPGKFLELVSQPGDPEVLHRISSNIDSHVVFINIQKDLNVPYSPILQDALYKVLKAYSVLNPIEGYYPAHGQIALILVMHMPAEEAFWCFVAIFQRYLPGTNWSRNLVQVFKLDHLLKEKIPDVHRHLLAVLGVDRFQCILLDYFDFMFTGTLPWTCVLRIWDMFFSEGERVLFNVGFLLVEHVVAKASTLKNYKNGDDDEQKYETLLKLLLFPITDLDEENKFVSMIVKKSISKVDLEKMEISKNVAPMKLIEESIVDFMDFDYENEENEE